MAELPRVVLSEEELRRFCQGQAVSLDRLDGEGETAVFDGANRLIATAVWDPMRRALRPDKVLRGALAI